MKKRQWARKDFRLMSTAVLSLYVSDGNDDSDDGTLHKVPQKKKKSNRDRHNEFNFEHVTL